MHYTYTTIKMITQKMMKKTNLLFYKKKKMIIFKHDKNFCRTLIFFIF